MMTFKAFLGTQDDAITDEEAASKYNEYKLEFRRQQLNEFFVSHRGEEWFMEKYHPVHSKKREDLALAGVKKRLEVWQQLESQIPVCVEESSKLEAFLDQVVAKLEHREEDKEGEDGLHKTSSIFLKTLPANITREELEEICKKFPGFLRVCLSDPVPAKKWQRKAWVTFKENTKVREICYSLNNTKIRGCELSSLVNKPLSQRIRSVPVLNCDGKVARGHILLASKIVANLDLQRGLWQGGKNPVLENIQDFLVEEVSAEEEELLGKTTTENQDEASKSEEEPAVLAALDRILVYLRVVHSVDFYTGAEYKSEEEMPNKCGIFHARPKFPEDLAVSQADVQTLLTSSEKSLTGVLKPTVKLTDTEAGKLGLKTESDEVEKFIGSNCQEVAQDKWLCPLSGKKFKGPDYIRKHIVNKFPERLEEVKQDTAFFNNYLRDPSRPELPIIQGVRASSSVGGRRDDWQGQESEDGQRQPASAHGGKKRSVHERLGRPGEVRVTQAAPDPRDIVDYSDVDMVGALDFF